MFGYIKNWLWSQPQNSSLYQHRNNRELQKDLLNEWKLRESFVSINKFLETIKMCAGNWFGIIPLDELCYEIDLKGAWLW